MSRPATGSVVELHGGRGRTFAIRFRAYGRRHYVTLDGVKSEAEARVELQNVLADVRRGIWQPPRPEPVVPQQVVEPSFHELRRSGWRCAPVKASRSARSRTTSGR
jgi:hypothetical protein